MYSEETKSLKKVYIFLYFTSVCYVLNSNKIFFSNLDDYACIEHKYEKIKTSYPIKDPHEKLYKAIVK